MEVHLITSWYSRRRPGKNATIKKVQLLKVIDNRVTPEIELRARNYPIDEETLRVARETPELVPQYIKDHPEKNLIFFGESRPQAEFEIKLTVDRILNHPETSNVLRNKELRWHKVHTKHGIVQNTSDAELRMSGRFENGLYHYDMEILYPKCNTKLFSIKDFTTKKGWDFGTFREDLQFQTGRRKLKGIDPEVFLDNCKEPFQIVAKRDWIMFSDALGSGVNFGRGIQPRSNPILLYLAPDEDSILLVLLTRFNPVTRNIIKEPEDMHSEFSEDFYRFMTSYPFTLIKLLNPALHDRDTNARLVAKLLLKILELFFSVFRPSTQTETEYLSLFKHLAEQSVDASLCPKPNEHAELERKLKSYIWRCLEGLPSEEPRKSWTDLYFKLGVGHAGHKALMMQERQKAFAVGAFWRCRGSSRGRIWDFPIGDVLKILSFPASRWHQSHLGTRPDRWDYFDPVHRLLDAAGSVLWISADTLLVSSATQLCISLLKVEPDSAGLVPTSFGGLISTPTSRVRLLHQYKRPTNMNSIILDRLGDYVILNNFSEKSLQTFLHIPTCIREQKICISSFTLKSNWQCRHSVLGKNFFVQMGKTSANGTASPNVVRLYYFKPWKRASQTPKPCKILEQALEKSFYPEELVSQFPESLVNSYHISNLSCSSRYIWMTFLEAGKHGVHLVALEVKRGADIKDTTLEFKGHFLFPGKDKRPGLWTRSVMIVSSKVWTNKHYRTFGIYFTEEMKLHLFELSRKGGLNLMKAVNWFSPGYSKVLPVYDAEHASRRKEHKEPRPIIWQTPGTKTNQILLSILHYAKDECFRIARLTIG